MNEIWQQRLDALKRIKADKPKLYALKQFYKENPVAFINDWGVTFDPRNAEIGQDSKVPFLLFPRQEEFVNWVFAHWKNREDGLAEKSRDMGVSWLCVAIAVWMWLFYDGVVVGFGSRKEEYVDKLGDPKSLFWKIRYFIDWLPEELKPRGYDEKKHAPHMRILNLENNSAIVGEAGDNIGRGNRTSIYFKDESAFYEHPENIDAALSQTSNCKIDISTPNGNGNPFYMKRHSGKIDVFTFHWTQDPRKNEEWYKKQVGLLDPTIVAQEIDIDYNASTTDAFISGELIEAAQRTGAADVEAVGKWIIGVDAAHFGDDESVIHFRKGRLNLPQVTRRKLDGIQLAAVVEAECDKVGFDSIFKIVIELDGAGVSCFDQLKIGRYTQKVQGIHTGARLSDNKNYNLKAKMYRGLQEYFSNQPVSLPRDAELKSQLASIKYLYKDGLLLMQAKKDYKKVFAKSPDRADAMALTFAVYDVKPKTQTYSQPVNFWAQ